MRNNKKVLNQRHPILNALSAPVGHLPHRGRKIWKGYGEKKKVLVALSGGIDSAVSAYLLIQKGYQVEAAFMKNWSSTKGLLKNECPWLEDRRDVLRVAAFLGIKLYTLDFEKQYQNRVMNYFFREYRAGRTPNPDVMCNKEIKFGLLYDWARKNGFDYLATGHYAQIGSKQQVVSSKKRKRNKKTYNLQLITHHLMRSTDEFKDQTYFIYNIQPGQLPHILFPVGGMKKTAVRALARKIGLPNAEKKESMGLCFVGKIRLKDFLAQKLKNRPGAILDQNGKKIGRHEGLHQFTIGQRQGIKVGATGPYYVFSKDLRANVLQVTNNPKDPRLFTKEVQLHSVNWIATELRLRIKDKGLKINLLGRYRHQGELVPLTISQIKKDLYRVVFARPQKAVASGQSLVLYQGQECVGGGVIA